MEKALADVILTDKQLSSSAYTHTIQAPIEKVDIAGWLFTLRSRTPQQLASVTAATTTAAKPRSLLPASSAKRWAGKQLADPGPATQKGRSGSPHAPLLVSSIT
jgi:hypothetical protein